MDNIQVVELGLKHMQRVNFFNLNTHCNCKYIMCVINHCNGVRMRKALMQFITIASLQYFPLFLGYMSFLFSENPGPAFACFQWSKNVGYSAGMIISTSVCVITKMYILIGCAGMSIISYLILQCHLRSRKK